MKRKLSKLRTANKVKNRCLRKCLILRKIFSTKTGELIKMRMKVSGLKMIMMILLNRKLQKAYNKVIIYIQFHPKNNQ